MFIFDEGLTHIPIKRSIVASAMSDVIITLTDLSESNVDEEDDNYKDDLILKQILECRFAKIRKVLESDSNVFMVTRCSKKYDLVENIEGV